MSGVLSFLKMIFMLVAVIIMAQMLLKFMNTYMANRNRIIKIIEKIPVNNNSYLSIVDIAGKYYLMSFTGKDNRILKELDSKELEDLILEVESKGKKSWMWNEEEN